MQRNKENLNSIRSFYLFIFKGLTPSFHDTERFSLSWKMVMVPCGAEFLRTKKTFRIVKN